MAELEIRARIIKTVWWHMIAGLANKKWATRIRRAIALFVAKHRLCVCMFKCDNLTSFYTIEIEDGNVKVVGNY